MSDTDLTIVAKVVGDAAAKLGAIDAATEKLGATSATTASRLQSLNVAGGAAAASLLAGAAAFTAAAVAGEGQALALERLGPAYAEVQRQTAGTVTAQEALRAQQSLLQSGLTVSAEQLGTITRAAREYARATGTDTTQAVEQLSMALVNGEAGGLRRFGIAVQQGADRAHTFDNALRQLRATQQASAPAARTLSEETEAFGRSFADAGGALALFGARAIGLNDILASVSSRLRTLAQDAQDLNQLHDDLREQRQRNDATNAARTRHVAALRAVRGSLEAAGIRDVELPADISSLTNEQVDQVSARLEAIARRMPNDRMSAEDIARRQGTVAAPRQGDFTFSALEDIARERRTSGSAFREARTNAPVELASLALDIQRMRDEAAPAAEATTPAATTPTTHTAHAASNASSAFDAAAAADAARLQAIDVARKARIATEIELARAIEERGRAEKNATVALDTVIDTERRARAEVVQLAADQQSADNALRISQGRESEVNRERVTQLVDLRAALSAMLAETDARIAQAQDEHRAQSEINDLMRERIGLTRSLTQTSTELAAIQRENSRGTREFADAMGGAGLSAASALTDALWAAADAHQSFGAAVQAALREQLKALAKEAVPNVLKNLALAAAAAFTNPAAVPGHLAAAGLWTAVGTAAGIGAAAIPAPAAARAPAGAPAAASVRGAGTGDTGAPSGPLTLQINVSGALLNEGVQEGVVRALNDAHARGVMPRFVGRA